MLKHEKESPAAVMSFDSDVISARLFLYVIICLFNVKTTQMC